MSFDLEKAMAALEQLCDTVEATGGVYRTPDGYPHPGGDLDWVDLGEAYLAACAAFEREPMVVDVEDLGDACDLMDDALEDDMLFPEES